MAITDQVQHALDRTSRWSPKMARRMCSVKLRSAAAFRRRRVSGSENPDGE